MTDDAPADRDGAAVPPESSGAATPPKSPTRTKRAGGAKPAGPAKPAASPPATDPTQPGMRSVPGRVADALGDAIGEALGVAADRVEHVASAVGHAVEATARRLDERPGARVRRVRRLGHHPLPYLYDVHPDARRRSPRELGVRTIEPSEIAGTAVGGGQQRGGDFLPRKPFRTDNWAGRWQRLGRASRDLTVLPPIDVLRYDDTYWVHDGHNRVALALYSGQAGIDADVTDLVDPAEPRSEPAESFASLAEDSRELRAAVSRPRRHGTTEPSS